jgi:hypothetical protein
VGRAAPDFDRFERAANDAGGLVDRILMTCFGHFAGRTPWIITGKISAAEEAGDDTHSQTEQA